MAKWPTNVATDADLYVEVNTLFSFLSSAVGVTDIVVPLVSITGPSGNFPPVGIILVDNELILYTAISGTSLLGCTRGFDGTTAASHAIGAQASACIPAAHHNVLKDEIKAVETYLSGLFGLGATISQPVSLNNHKLTNVTDPTANQDAATKHYVDTHSGTAPGGSPSSVQFNSFGAFGGDLLFTYGGAGNLLLGDGSTTPGSIQLKNDGGANGGTLTMNTGSGVNLATIHFNGATKDSEIHAQGDGTVVIIADQGGTNHAWIHRAVGSLGLPPLSGRPGSPTEGDMIYNSSTHHIEYFNGTSWIML